ncbi:ThuA domain-containing protein [Novosphingobium sp.]|uniref:ThuA domain-containing protein n=1 Tax=Novosphingobium sp. TaxID=1874826 RepID=UPI0026294CB3|nr:ThuA domain-containing protein [Novosphingobium sp.]
MSGDGALRLILYSDGYNHPFARSSEALASIARGFGLAVTITSDLADALGQLQPGRDVLGVNALRWSMTQFERYAADRPLWAGRLSSEHLAAMTDHVARGGGLLAMHTAVICWDNQPGWLDLLGGGWNWDRSHHPPLGPITVQPLAAGAVPFEAVDEAYHHLDPAADCEIMATADAGEGAQPVVWRRRHGSGRIVVDALGHDERSLGTTGHVAILQAMLGWLCERETVHDA